MVYIKGDLIPSFGNKAEYDFCESDRSPFSVTLRELVSDGL